MSISTDHDPITTRTPSGWTAGHGDDAQSATFRALAWSQADDAIAEPVQYAGDEYRGSGSLADSAPTRLRRSTLVCGIAVGFAAAAIGGLVLTVVNTDDGPVTIPTQFTEPAAGVVNPQPSGDTASRGAPVRASSQAPVKATGAPAYVVPSAAAPTRASAAPAPVAAAPQAPAPKAPAPQAPAPQPTVPAAAAPKPTPSAWVPPIILPPVVSLPPLGSATGSLGSGAPLEIPKGSGGGIPTVSSATIAERPPLGDVQTVHDPVLPAAAVPPLPVLLPPLALGGDQ